MSRATSTLTAAGVTIDCERMRLPNNLLRVQASIIEGALTEMRSLEAGDIVNHDEGWQTGHYWLRDPELAPAAYQKSIRETIASVKAFAAGEFRGKYSNVLWIGIGGSGLGPQMLYDALRVPGKTPLMVFFDNTDPAGFDRALADLAAKGGLQQTLAVVVSKSGGTKETRNGMLVAQQAYQRAGLPAEVEPFLYDMGRRLQVADLVVCRAGATTLAELTAAGKPSILIPLPTATDDHQRKNAEALAAGGAAEVLLQSEATGERLAGRILTLASDAGHRQAMAHAARALARPDAARVIVDRALALAS